MRFNDETPLGRILGKVRRWLDTEHDYPPVVLDLPPHKYADSLKTQVLTALEEAIAKNPFHKNDCWIFGPLQVAAQLDHEGNLVITAQISAHEQSLTFVCCQLTIGNDISKRVTVLCKGDRFLTTETGATFEELLAAAITHVETWKSPLAPIRAAA